MRIVAGKFGGRRLSAVPGRATRPTTDKVKEALFNIIGPYFDGGTSLDLYAGSGGLSIEAVSRGINSATLIDRQYAAIKTIKKNVEVTKAVDQFHVYKQDAVKALHILGKKGQPFNLIFLDPPYAKQQIVRDMTSIEKLNLASPDAVCVAETNQEANLPDQIGQWMLKRRQEYGITVLNIYQFKGALS